MKFSHTFMALMLCVLIAPAALACEADSTAISPETLAPLASWVEHNMHVDMEMLPTVTISDRNLKRALRIEDVQKAGAVGAYLPGRITISPSVWDAQNDKVGIIAAQSYVVHELVHHAQFLSGRTYSCHAAKEREAYTLQNKWLAEHGHAPLVDAGWIDRMSACPAANEK